MVYEAKERWRSLFGWEKVVKERLGYLGRVSGTWQIRESLWRATKREPFGRPEGVWSGRGQEVGPVCLLG